MTGFFGGSIASTSRVVTLDWSTMEYTTHSPQLLMPRIGSVCAVVKDKDGSAKVAIVGGTSKGIEFWNPADGTVEQVSYQIPAEDGSSIGLTHTQMLPINDGSEFILYSGYKVSHHKAIWRYNVAAKTWTKAGNVLTSRGEHVTLPVTGIDCS